MSSTESPSPPQKKTRTEDDEEVSDSELSESEVDEIVPPRPPPPPTVRTVDDEDIPESEISSYGYHQKTKYINFGNRIFRNSNFPEMHEEYDRQADRFEYLFERSDGFEINWDEFDFLFVSRSVDWVRKPLADDGKTNDELIEYLTRCAIEKHNKESEHPTNVVYVGPVMANFWCAAGLVFFITFWARDLLSPDPEPKLYQTKVRRFGDLIDVTVFRLRPNYEEMEEAANARGSGDMGM